MNVITHEHINNLYDLSEKDTWYVFNKCLVLSIKLPNGYIITESTCCVDKANDDYKVGYDIAVSKIKAKIWELEGYRLCTELKSMIRE